MDDSVHVAQTSSDERLLREYGASDAYRRQFEYAARLARYGSASRLTVFVLHPSAQVPVHETDNLRIEHVPDRWPRNLLLLSKRLRELHRTNPVSVVSSQTVFDDAWACHRFCRSAGVPLVGQVHFDLFSRFARRVEFGDPPWNTLRWYLARRMIRRMTAVRVVGTGLQREILRRRWNKHVPVIPVPVSLDGETQSNTAETREQRTILFVGRLVPPKNVPAILEVTRRICCNDPDVRLQIAGDGPLRAELEQTALRLGIQDRVRFLGAVDYDELPRLYRSASLLLMPSLYEGFGRVSVEASLHELPVVATRINGLEDTVIDGQTGYLCPPGDLDALQSAVENLLADPALRQRMGQAARDFARSTFDPTLLADAWIELLVKTARTAA